MAGRSTEQSAAQPQLSRELVLRGAMAIADEGGIGSMTIRSLAQRLNVKPMSVYYYVANKDDILDAIVDLVFSEIELPDPSGHWRTELLKRADSARAALRAHPWAIGLMESRTSPGPATLRHHDAVIATLRGAGFTEALTAHAYALLDSYIYGFALQEAGLPFHGTDTLADVAEPIIAEFSTGDYPHLVQMATNYYMRPGYNFSDEFAWGLELICDGLEQRHE
jgi:AcrR family transcriptional regulator